MKVNHKSFFSLLIFFFFHFITFSQVAPGIQWENTIGGTDSDILWPVQQTTDGGYILGGFSVSNISGDKTEMCIGERDFWIVKADSSGTVLWQNTIGGSDIDELFSLEQTTDGGYILGGTSNSEISGDKTENSVNGNGWDYWIVKTDSTGNIQWQNTIGGSAGDEIRSLQQTADGGYILGGNSTSNISGDKTEMSFGDYDFWIVKTDSLGNIQWQKSIGGSNRDELYSIGQTADGGYILGGHSRSDSSGLKTENSNGIEDYWIVKTDSTGNIQWQHTIGGSNRDMLYSIRQTTDGGYILGGYSSSNISGDKTENSNGYEDCWIIKTDSAGNIQWQNTIGGNYGDVLRNIGQTTDGGYILCSTSGSNISGDKTENCIGSGDFWIVKTDSAGIIKWDNTIGGSTEEESYSVQQTIDGGFILGGLSNSNISGDKTEDCIGHFDYWIIKLAPETLTSMSYVPYSTFGVQVSPNPLTNESKIIFKNLNKDIFIITMYEITGKILERISVLSDELIISKGNRHLGVYFLNLLNTSTGEQWNGKILIAN